MRLRTLFLLSLLVAVPLFGQQFPGATVKDVDASRGMREAVRSAGTKWVAWSVPVSGVSICCNWRDGGCCGSCSLEGSGFSINDDSPRPTNEMLIAARLGDDGSIEKIRMFDAACSVSAPKASIARLMNVTPAASVDYLLGRVRDADDEGELLAAISMHDHPKVVPSLISLARNDPNTKVRRSAIFWLGQKAGDKAAGELRHAVDHDPNDEVREHAVFAISQLPRERSVPMLIDLVKTHKSRKVRERAMFWLAQTNDPRAIDLIEQILTK